MITNEQLTQAIVELRNSIFELKSSQEETTKQVDKTTEQMKETTESLKKIGKMVGGISNNQGDVAEEFFYNSLASKPRLAGIDYDFINKNAHKRIGKVEDEYDILLVNGKDVAIIETKYKAHTRDVERLINKKYENFKKLYPEYKDYTHHLGLASFNINEDVKELASQNNVILIQRKGDLIETIMPNERVVSGVSGDH
jgi:predicted RNase H-like nuclease (RuvC/YqgF family)